MLHHIEVLLFTNGYLSISKLLLLFSVLLSSCPIYYLFLYSLRVSCNMEIPSGLVKSNLGGQ